MYNSKYVINGAGVMLIEKYKNKNNRTDYAIILFRDIHSGKYIDAGGRMELGENLMMTATEELKEESANLFRIHPKYTTHIVMYKSYSSFPIFITGPRVHRQYDGPASQPSSINHKYPYNQGHAQRPDIAPGSGSGSASASDYMYQNIYDDNQIDKNRFGPIFSKYYKHNVNLMHYKYDTPDSYRETNDMKRFYISDLIFCGLLDTNSDLTCSDANGNYAIIGSRAVNILRETIFINIIKINNDRSISINLPLITLDIMQHFKSPLDYEKFLDGTVSYYAN